MFALPTPYIAERQVMIETDDSKYKFSWERCKVIGVGKDEDGEPVYVCEIFHHGTFSLVMEAEVRRLEPGNPL
jgi:hypothetical protein